MRPNILALISTISTNTLVSASFWSSDSDSNSISRPDSKSLNCPTDCPKTCNTLQLLTCPAGISSVRDECGCECPVCAKQHSQTCDGMNPCDPVKNLFCHPETSMCENMPGKNCYVSGQVYESGDKFQPSCKLNCTCLNGDVGCMPACKIELDNTKPPCPIGKLAVRVLPKGECCEEWQCQSKSKQNKYSHSSIGAAPQGEIVVGAAARRPTKIDSGRRGDGCFVQTTEWTPCSKTCGVGISERVSNNNKACKLRREVRLCNVRPCRKEYLPKNSHKKCTKTTKSTKSIRLSLSGCISERKFKPKFCGSCGDKCCIPDKTKTKKFNLVCGDTKEVLTKDYMWISSCKCSTEYCNLRPEIFYGYHHMKSDYHKAPVNGMPLVWGGVILFWSLI